MAWRFTWNAEKAEANWKDHGVRFEEAQETCSKKRLLFTVVTIDEESKTAHIISSREPERWERSIYEEETS